MKQRVNIQYSILLDDLESETRRLTDRTQEQLSAVAKYNLAKSSVLSLDCLAQIEDLRHQLAQIDRSLDDIEKIISGYLHYKSASRVATPAQTAIAENTSEHLHDTIEPEGSMQSIRNAIEQFKHSHTEQ